MFSRPGFLKCLSVVPPRRELFMYLVNLVFGIALICGACGGGRVPACPGVHSALTWWSQLKAGPTHPCPLHSRPSASHLTLAGWGLSPDPILPSAFVLRSVPLASTGPLAVLVFRGAQSEEVGSGLEVVLRWGVTHVALMTRLRLWVWGRKSSEGDLLILSHGSCDCRNLDHWLRCAG